MSKPGVFSGPYFPVFWLNTEIYFFNPNTGKYGLEKTPLLDTFHALSFIPDSGFILQITAFQLNLVNKSQINLKGNWLLNYYIIFNSNVYLHAAAATRAVLLKLYCLKLFKTHRKTSVSESIKKDTSTRGFSCEFYEVFKNICFLRKSANGCFYTWVNLEVFVLKYAYAKYFCCK